MNRVHCSASLDALKYKKGLPSLPSLPSLPLPVKMNFDIILSGNATGENFVLFKAFSLCV